MTRRPPTLLLALAVPVIALVAVVATRAVEGPSPSTVASAGSANAVVIKNFEYEPPDLIVTQGSSVEVTNADDAAHTLTAKDDSFGTGDLGDGESAMITLEQSGTFSYYCKIHNYMTGTLVVK
jgi:plastocyanin